MKTISYKNGYTSFQLPDNWVEEDEGEGTWHFYDAVSDDEFSLRFSVITFRPPDDMPHAKTEDAMNACGIPDYAEKIMIDSNNLLAIHSTKEEGEDTDYLIHYFEYLHRKSNGYFDLAIFTWSIEERLEHETTYINLLSMIETQARGLKFKD